MNTSTLSEFRQNIPGSNDNRNGVGFKINIFFFPWRLFAQHVSHVFGYFSFRWGYLDNQSEYRKSPIHFC